MNLALLVQAITAALAAAPRVIEVATKAKEFVTGLFTAKAITKAEQDAVHAHVDSICGLAEVGALPGHWKVEADPA